MAPTLFDRIWSRFKRVRADSQPSQPSVPSDRHASAQGNLVLQHDLELAVQADALIRNAREIFDTDLIEPQSTKDHALSTIESHLPFAIDALPPAIEAPPLDVNSVSPVTEADDSHLHSFFESLRDKRPKSQPAPDLSSLIPFALPLEPAIAPQLSKQAAQTRGRMALRERALARASQFAEIFQLSNEETRSLARILKHYRLHHKVITELESLLLSGYTADELLTAHRIRKIWRRSEYSRTSLLRHHQDSLQRPSAADLPYATACDFLEEGYKLGEGAIFTTSISIPTWRQAASWARVLGNISSTELDSLLYWHYERWLETPPLWKSRPSFAMHVDCSIRTVAHDLCDRVPWETAFEQLPLNDYDEHELERSKVRELYALGLIPDIWLDPFDERLSIDPEFPNLNDYWPKKGEVDDDE